jgi:hypothetical protein
LRGGFALLAGWRFDVSDAHQLRTYRLEAIGLDPITVYVEQFRPGAGRMTVQCYARAWTGFWGSHGAEAPLEAFVASCDAEYIADGLVWGTNSLILKRREKDEHAYVTRIVRAIQAHFRQAFKEAA